MIDKKIMFRTTGYLRNNIEQVEVVKMTACFVTYIQKYGNRKCESRVSRDGFFDTWEEARSSLLKKAEYKVESARRQLELANAELGNIKGMKPPAAKQEAQ